MDVFKEKIVFYNGSNLMGDQTMSAAYCFVNCNIQNTEIDNNERRHVFLTLDLNDIRIKRSGWMDG